MQRRRTIAEAALRVFCERGYAATTMDDIRARAGCSKGGLYHHFGARERVMEAVAELLAAEEGLSPPLGQVSARLGVEEAALGRLVVEIWAASTRDGGIRGQLAGMDAMPAEELVELGRMIAGVTRVAVEAEEARRAA
jgi:AcrR family transcriptional regulator